MDNRQQVIKREVVMFTSQELWNQMSPEEQKEKIREITDNLNASKTLCRVGLMRTDDAKETDDEFSRLISARNNNSR